MSFFVECVVASGTKDDEAKRFLSQALLVALVHCLRYPVYLSIDILRHDATTDTCTSTQTVEHARISVSLPEFQMASHVEEVNSCTGSMFFKQ